MSTHLRAALFYRLILSFPLSPLPSLTSVHILSQTRVHRLGSPPLYTSIHSCLLPPFLRLPRCRESADAGCFYLRRYSTIVSDTVGKQNTESDLLLLVLDAEV